MSICPHVYSSMCRCNLSLTCFYIVSKSFISSFFLHLFDQSISYIKVLTMACRECCGMNCVCSCGFPFVQTKKPQDHGACGVRPLMLSG